MKQNFSNFSWVSKADHAVMKAGQEKALKKGACRKVGDVYIYPEGALRLWEDGQYFSIELIVGPCFEPIGEPDFTISK